MKQTVETLIIKNGRSYDNGRNFKKSVQQTIQAEDFSEKSQNFLHDNKPIKKKNKKKHNDKNKI